MPASSTGLRPKAAAPASSLASRLPASSERLGSPEARETPDGAPRGGREPAVGLSGGRTRAVASSSRERCEPAAQVTRGAGGTGLGA
jgi:hypothetical protein